MAFDYTEMQNVAEELISSFGQSGLLKIRKPGGDPWNNNSDFAEIDITAVRLNSTKEDIALITNTTTFNESCVFYIVAKDIEQEPKPNMCINYEGQDWTIDHGKEVQPRTLKLYYRMVAVR